MPSSQQFDELQREATGQADLSNIHLLPHGRRHGLSVLHNGTDTYRYRVFGRERVNNAAVIELTVVAPARDADARDGDIIVRLDDPRMRGSLWTAYTLLVAACPPSAAGTAGQQIAQLGSSDAPTETAPREMSQPILATGEVVVTTLGLGLISGLFILAVAIGLLALVAHLRARKNDLPLRRGLLLNLTGLHYHLSLAKVQMLAFSVAVVVIVAYVFGRTGQLSDLSEDVLLLLGIAAGSTAIAFATDGHRERLSWENWIWLKETEQVLPDDRTADPKWYDLFSSHGEFDAARFQALVFTILVVPAFLIMSVFSLGTVEIPNGILAVLGLSQVTYLAGKMVAPPTVADFDRALTEYRDKVAQGEVPDPEKTREIMASFEAALGQKWPVAKKLNGISRRP